MVARLLPSPSLDAWHSSLGGRVHLSPCVSLHLSPVVSPPGCLARLSGWTRSFVSLGSLLPLSPFICLPLSPSLDDPVWVDGFICLPLSFVSRCLPAWMPGTAPWVDGFICLPLSPFICLPAWMPGAARVHLSPFVSLHLSPVVSQPGCLGGHIHLSPFVSLHLSPVVSQPGSGTALWVDGFMCLPLSPSFVSRSLPAWMPGTALWVDGFICLPLSPLISPVVSQPGCLARLSGWTGSFVSLCLPSFVSRCLPAWMPGAALWVDGFICLPLSPRMSGTRLFPFICLPLSLRLDGWHCFFGGQIHFSPFVSLHLAPVVSQPGCLSRLSRRTDSLVSLGSPSFVSHLCGWTDSFVSLCLPLFVSRCLPAWMPGTALWVDGFICLPLSPSLVWHSRSAVSFTSRGSVLLAGSGCLRLWPWLRSFLVLWMLGTGSSSVCPSSGLRFRLGSWWVVFLVYRWLHPVCSFSASLSVAVPS